MDFPIYDLLINEDEGSDAEVSFIALVDSPAIKKSFLQFNDNFIDPNKGEKKDEFLNRCISYVINEGKENEQAVAICNSLWEQHFAEDSYTDYPKQASENAKAALRYAEKYGWNECGTPVGKARANQLANNEPISRDTIARMASFARHKENSNKELGDGCGRLMWLAWGGDAGVEWASNKLKQIDKFAATKISFDYDDTLNTSRGKELAKKEINAGNTVYIISARSDKSPMLSVAKDLGIPESRVYATGSNKAKIEKVKELGITKHYDNNADVVKELGSIGEKFGIIGFAIQSESEHIITGPLMIPQQLIYRKSERFGEHYVKFSVDTIKQIAIKFSKKGYQKNVNLMHEADMQVEGLTMFESFISDTKRGIKPMEAFKDLPDGTWFGSFYVENPKVWELIKKGEVKGFSVEGMFDYEQPTSNAEAMLAKLSEILNNIK
jgi:hydroxymethylpyrimidine pyrophosphatase-like HAD family hydrolase